MTDSINSVASASSIAATKTLSEGARRTSVKGSEEMNEPKGVPDIDDTVQISKAAQKASEIR